ncbi:exocyst subunit exo70 family protein H4 [Actinidia rufa]|uniref:Exocyst subunit Exo70 family protein n=1 Tax=Actinidia rufa TaxID=165716 RepID=A0A7J0FWE4_9ERIC|nr:exocyst subunit exo70 family protein H4 [Actinidia rufa]
MPRKGMMGHFFSSKSSSKSSSSAISHGSSPSRASLYTPTSSFSSDAAMERTLATAETMITKWNADISSFAKVTSLFYENPKEARDYIKCVHDLQKSMHLLVMEDSNSEKLVRGQNLMETAMKRLQKEFYQILSMNRAHLDPESVSARTSRSSTRSSTSDDDDDDGSEDEIRIAGESITEVEDVSAFAMADLRSIAECMISSGYGKECVTIYKIIRKSIVDEGIYKLGVEKISSSQIQKMDWDALEVKINNWLKSVKIAVKTLFNGERILCDQVFAASESIKESCFTEISREGAQILFGFPEIVARSGKKSPEKIFRTLDMYTAISSHWPEIESIFSFESTSVVLSQSVNSLIKLGDSVRTMMVEFESAIQKDASKSAIAGGGVHHLTIHVMDYLSLLADYSNSWSTSSTAILRQQSRQCRSRTLIPPTPTSLQHRRSPSDSRGSSSFSYANSTENQSTTKTPYIEHPVSSRRRLGDEARIQSQAVRGKLRAAWVGPRYRFHAGGSDGGDVAGGGEVVFSGDSIRRSSRRTISRPLASYRIESFGTRSRAPSRGRLWRRTGSSTTRTRLCCEEREI